MAQIVREFVSVDEAQEMTGISHWTWRKWASSRRISSSKLGRRLLIPVDEIQRLADEGARSRKVSEGAGATQVVSTSTEMRVSTAA